MYQDYNEYEKFYQTELGKNVQYFISSQLKKFIYLYDGDTIGCFGFSHNYLNHVKVNKIKIFNCFSKKVGAKKSLENNQSINILLEEEKLPIEDLFLNHVLSIHYLENSSNLKKTLREFWRVLAPEGKAYIILPNKKSSWSHSSKSPFSSGFGFSKQQIYKILEDNFFETQFVERLIYFPPWNYKFILNNKFFFEKIGSYFWRFFNGVYLCVIKKRIYASTAKRSLSFSDKVRIIKKVD